jgi:hypothetical protein
MPVCITRLINSRKTCKTPLNGGELHELHGRICQFDLRALVPVRVMLPPVQLRVLVLIPVWYPFALLLPEPYKGFRQGTVGEYEAHAGNCRK